jgi:hypothetical protein
MLSYFLVRLNREEAFTAAVAIVNNGRILAFILLILHPNSAALESTLWL